MNRSPAGEETLVFIGHMHVSKADRSQVLDLQRDALAVTGFAADRLGLDRASDERPSGAGLRVETTPLKMFRGVRHA